MLRAPNGDLRLWLGSVVLHLLFVLVIAVAALRWRAERPMPQLAIEGSLVRYEDLPAAVRTGKPLREPSTTPSPTPPEPEPTPREPVVEPAPSPRPEAAREQALAAKEQAAAAAESRRVEQQRAADATARATAEQQRKAESQRKLEAAAALQQQEQAKAEREARLASEREAKLKAAREATLQAALAEEEAGEAIAQSGVIDEYRALLVQTIQRNWIRPATARAGLECTLYVTQATGGTVLDVKLGDCNGDAAVRESVTNAVYRSSPLPAPRDARAFERRLVIVFKPTE
jgi:colicin import membrane protein